MRGLPIGFPLLMPQIVARRYAAAQSVADAFDPTDAGKFIDVDDAIRASRARWARMTSVMMGSGISASQVGPARVGGGDHD
jgi:hypothetical protein